MKAKGFFLLIGCIALPLCLFATDALPTTASMAASAARPANETIQQRIPITGTVHHLHLPDKRQKTFISVVIGKEFPGKVPENIDAIEIEGPKGILPIARQEFRYVPHLREFWVERPGIPEIGTYTFTVRSGDAQGTSTNSLTAIRKLPIPRSPKCSPSRWWVIRSNRPTFSWVIGEIDAPIYYQLFIDNARGGRVYSTQLVLGMRSHQVPDGVLKVGGEYRWRVRAVDGHTWFSVQNRSHTRWHRITMAKSFDYVYRAPEKTDDGWEIASLKEVCVDALPLHSLIRAIINRQVKDIHSVLLVKNGKLVLEEYFYGYERHNTHLLASVTKSVTSILFGIAVDRGIITDIEEAAYSYFPEYNNPKDIDKKIKITVQHLLTMSAGLAWDALTVPLEDPRYPTRQMFASGNPIRFILHREVVASPGRSYNYNDGLTLLLGEIIHRASGLPADEFAATYLFPPLGISEYRWDRSRDGTVETNGGLHLRPRDMAKIGLLVLQDGRWGDRQVVSREWLRESTEAHIEGYGVGYGYQWRRAEVRRNERRIDVIWASGYGGQRIFVIPKLDAIAIFTSKVLYNPRGGTLAESLFVSHILPSLLPAASKPKPLGHAPANLSRYVGAYRSKYGLPAGKVVLEGGKLYLHVQVPFEEKAELTPVSEREFFGSMPEVGDFRIRIIETKTGKVDHAIFESGLKRWRIERVKW